MSRLRTLFLYKTVFLTGAAVLVIEIAAVRMLSPYYGSSLYVFSSVLTIILAALSLGYYVGGRLADRQPRYDFLYGVIAISGVLTLLAQFLALQVLPLAQGIFSFLSGPLIFGFLLFFFPAFLLGIVSPYLVKLITISRSESEIGQIAGTVFFWGTVGSITGSLMTGFLLIPLLGIQTSMIGTGVLLLLLGIAGLLLGEYLTNRTSFRVAVAKHVFFIMLTVCSAVIITGLIARTETDFQHAILYESDGVYGHIIVYETTHRGHPLRALKRDTNNESATYLDSHDLVFEYTQFAEWYTDLVPDARRFLMIGGGAYSVPRTVLARDPDIEVVVSEIEPDLYPLAERFFDVTPGDRLKNHVVDGRVFLNENTEPFDVIFLDAFGTDLTLPAHLATREFYETVRKNLTPNGIVIINYIGLQEGEAPTLTGSLTKTIASVFPNMRMYGIYANEKDRRQNIVYVLRNGDAPIDLSEKVVRSMNGRPLLVSDMLIPHERYLSDDELIFTDDRAPIEYLMLPQYK